jgi:nucleotide-binding universal stress UspA family protein
MAERQGTEAGQKDHVGSGDDHMASRIVVGVDGSPGAVRALAWAGAEADRSGAELTIVGAWVYGGFGDDVLTQEDAELVVEQAAASVADQYPAVSVKHLLCKESAAHSLIEASRGADLLVVGSRGFGGFRSLLLGSVGQHCLTHSPCSVAIIRGHDDAQTNTSATNPHRIVVGVDGSDGSNLALDWAAIEASRTGALLEVVGSWVFPGTSGYVFAAVVGVPEAAREVVDEALARVARVAPHVATMGKTSEDPPAVSLVNASRGADLLVVGSRGLGAFRGLLLGSVGHHLAMHAHGSVVVVRGLRLAR